MSGRKMNLPIPGHALLHEGGKWRKINQATDDYYADDDPSGWSGGCRCGAKPYDWPNVGVNAVKRWHREHKEWLRSQGAGR